MFLLIAAFPVYLLACWVLPLLGTLFSKNRTQKWVIFWLLSMVLSYTLYPLLEYFLDCDYVMIVQIVASLGLIFALNKQQTAKAITDVVDKAAGVAREQILTVKSTVSKTLEQNGLIQPKA